MTLPKAALNLSPRTRAYPDAGGCASEFNISRGTWERWVRDGQAPPAVPNLDPPRWRWVDVDAWMSDPSGRPEIRRRYGQTEDPVATCGPSADGPDPFWPGSQG
ncbi:AlpA family transcriptional regulator [Methylobacterium sp. R2-1]|uniref:helix-turn-helix transcriptional regulator n=1 Tax=Methylobacterium sp. R2-1 TaxID=2587064 RepID=UPI00161D413F|nr:hypothetical protein [Methylobacterium sp. R2-1]MBB2964930.1 hypothetical protein [Methylobacterium sp. R2-1]